MDKCDWQYLNIGIVVSPTFRTKVTLRLMQGFCFFLNPDVRWLALWVMLRSFLVQIKVCFLPD